MSKVVFAGSSIFEAWSGAAEVAPGHAVVNRAVGGTTTLYWKENLQAVLEAERPAALCLYCGSNDLNNGVPGGEILENLGQCRAIAGAVRLAYFGILKAPQKQGQWDWIDELNARARRLLRESDLYVDLNAVLFHGGAPVRSFYLEDGLHLTTEAYKRMSLYSRPLILAWLADRPGRAP